MINHFIPRPNVKDHSIVMFRDDDDPFVFYYLNNTPRVAIDKDSQKPAFDFMVIGRNADVVDSSDVLEGRLVMTVNLALDEKEKAAVENAVREFIGSQNFVNDVNLYYPNYNTKKRTNNSVVSIRSQITSKFAVQVQGESKQVTIQPVEFNLGKASVNLASSDSQEMFAYETRPTLFGNCDATFVLDLDGGEANILYKILKSKEINNEMINLSAVVLYEMRFKAIVQSNASASVNYGEIYREISEIQRNLVNGEAKCREKDALGECLGFYIYNDELYTSKDKLQKYLCESSKLNQKLEIKLDSFDGSDGGEEEHLLMEALRLQMVEHVSDKLFEKVEPISNENIGNSGLCYRFRKELNDVGCNDSDISVVKKKIVEYNANPNASLRIALNEKYGVDSMVREFDASERYYQEMVVPIKVDNTNFGHDVAMVSVRVFYKDKSGAIKRDKIFSFSEENPETKFFRVIMNRDGNGRFIDKFYYQTRIRYRGFDVYERNLREEDKWTKENETQIINGGIYVPCNAIRNISVYCEAGDVAWDTIQKMDVEFKYKSNPEKRGATKCVSLTETNPSGTWNCYMYNEADDAYIYRVHYFYQDGSDDWSEEFEGSSIINKLTINDKLSGLFKIKFDIDFNVSVKKIRVIVKYQNKEEEGNWVYDDDCWIWQMRLKEEGDDSFQYKYQYYLVNGDDSLKESDWSAPIKMNTESNQQNVAIDLQINQIRLFVDGYSVDWSKWSQVTLHFKYADEANNLCYDYNQITPSTLDSNNKESVVVIPVVDNSVKPVFYAEYISLAGDVVLSDEVASNMCVVLPFAAPPKEDSPVSEEALVACSMDGSVSEMKQREHS